MAMGRHADRDNAWVAGQLRELAARLDLENEPHRPRAYRRAAETIEQLREPVAEIRAADGTEGLDRLPGVGPHIASLICELVDSGTASQLERLRKKAPVDVMGLLAVDGVGGKTVKVLWDELRVRTLDDLERALEEERVEGLPGFGKRRVERLRQALRIQRRGRERVRRKPALAIARRLQDAVEGHPSVQACSVAGSLRRGLPTVGDIDLVAASKDPEATAECLLGLPEVSHVYSRGPHRVSVRLEKGVDVDLRIVAPESYGSALLYFTGSRAHVVALRRLALAQGLRLNEYGLFRGRARIAGATEREIYEALSLPYLAPEQREGESEVRDALRKLARGDDFSASTVGKT
jgi:DNA polymerase (family 10)